MLITVTTIRVMMGRTLKDLIMVYKKYNSMNKPLTLRWTDSGEKLRHPDSKIHSYRRNNITDNTIIDTEIITVC